MNELKDLRFKGYNAANGYDIKYPFKQADYPKVKTGYVALQEGVDKDDTVFPFERYEELTLEVKNVVRDVRSGKYPHWFLEKYYPKEWGKYPGTVPSFLTEYQGSINVGNPLGCALAVQMDQSEDFGRALFDHLTMNDYKLKSDDDLNHIAFDHYQGRFKEQLGDALKRSFNYVFPTKWKHGVARPAEVNSFLNPNEELTDFGVYIFPNHPEYKSGHSTAATETAKCAIKEFELDDDKELEAKYGAFLFGHFRTFAGVHYGFTNNETMIQRGLFKK